MSTAVGDTHDVVTVAPSIANSVSRPGVSAMWLPLGPLTTTLIADGSRAGAPVVVRIRNRPMPAKVRKDPRPRVHGCALHVAWVTCVGEDPESRSLNAKKRRGLGRTSMGAPVPGEGREPQCCPRASPAVMACRNAPLGVVGLRPTMN